MSVEMALTGLMLICLQGQSDCPVGKYKKNTAWVVKADGYHHPCGWKYRESTDLSLRMEMGQGDKLLIDGSLRPYCSLDKDSATCTLVGEDFCVDTDTTSPEGLGQYLGYLPQLGQIDANFYRLSSYIEDKSYVPSRIHFTGGKIDGGPLWPKNIKPNLDPVEWSRTNDYASGGLPGPLSDRVIVTYSQASTFKLTDCKGTTLIFVGHKSTGVPLHVTFQNAAKAVEPYPYGNYENLGYLLWYYRLGQWASKGGACPDYDYKKTPVLLRCQGQGCSFYPQSNTRFWPPMLGKVH